MTLLLIPLPHQLLETPGTQDDLYERALRDVMLHIGKGQFEGGEGDLGKGMVVVVIAAGVGTS